MERSPIRLLGLCTALLIVVTLVLAAPAEERIVAIGDIHGDFADISAILQQTGLINAGRQWVGGHTLLVQVGDVVDRGPQSRECLDLLMALERQAPKRGGKVVVLLGNHEVMAMTADLRYVSPEDYQGFTTPQSEKVRESAYRDYLDFVASQNKGAPRAGPTEAERAQWMMDHPLGFFERRDAFGPKGVYGRWLRGHDFLFQRGDVVFVHGGLSPNLSFRSLQELNQQMHTGLASFDLLWQSLSEKKVTWKYMAIDEAIRQVQSEEKAVETDPKAEPELKQELQQFLDLAAWLYLPDSPIWYRGLAEEPEDTLGPGVDSLLARLKIGYIVVGHTPLPPFRINQRFGNRVFLIDTGMLHAVFGGRASALEIQGGRFAAYYVDEKPQILATPPSTTSPPAEPQRGAGAAHP